MPTIVNLPRPAPEARVSWIAALRTIEKALVDYSDHLSREEAIALHRAWQRIQQG